MLYQIAKFLLNNEYSNLKRIIWVIYSNIKHSGWFTVINRNLNLIIRILSQLWLNQCYIKLFLPLMLFIILIYNKWTLLLLFCLIFWIKLFMWSNLIILLKTLKYVAFARLYMALSSLLRYDIWPSWISCTNLTFINQSQIIKFSFLKISLSFLLFISMIFFFSVQIPWNLIKFNINSFYNSKWQILMRYFII